MTTARNAAGEENAMFRGTPTPASRCPRCQFAFGSADLMLDHLNADHLAHASPDGIAHGRTGAPAAFLPVSDAVLAGLETAFRSSSGNRHPRGLILAAVLVLLLLVAGFVAVLA
jgi:hypothetical protein